MSEAGSTLAAAQEVVAKSRRDREKKAEAEIASALEKYGCRLDVTVLLRAGQVQPAVRVVSLDS